MISGITTCSLEPSSSEASTNGDERSTLLPVARSIFSTRVAKSSWGIATGSFWVMPDLATKTSAVELIQISSIAGSSSRGCSGPKPDSRFWISDRRKVSSTDMWFEGFCSTEKSMTASIASEGFRFASTICLRARSERLDASEAMCPPRLVGGLACLRS